VIENLITDLDLTLGLSGCSSIAELGQRNLVEAAYLPSISKE
jgi:isopentenyl diphosphate isomerase/L-lactate dehydrogenase-like FMN-dependent dehydrogenase